MTELNAKSNEEIGVLRKSYGNLRVFKHVAPDLEIRCSAFGKRRILKDHDPYLDATYAVIRETQVICPASLVSSIDQICVVRPKWIGRVSPCTKPSRTDRT